MNIFLHRDDLRIHDNHALRKASEEAKTLPIYIEDIRILEKTGKNKQAFRERGILNLAEKYKEHDATLIYKKGNTTKQLKKLLKKFNVEKLYFNRSYTPTKRRIEKEIHKLDVETQSLQDRLLVEPQQLSEEYGTFSPYYQEWKHKAKLKPFQRPVNLVKIDKDSQLPHTEPSADIPQSGEEAAIKKWDKFRNNHLENYKDSRNDVSRPNSVSRLSMYYSSGMIGIRKVLNDLEKSIQKSNDSDEIRNIAKYRNELAWREFFYQVLWHNPQCITENYKDFENRIEWQNNSEEFEAWKKGKTGVPFVDAGMRELKKTGYMHNRTRQNVASFLTKHLMIDWRKGAKFFKRHLVDHDTASNNGGWQWAASTGTDSVPVRIFNPVKQGRKYDPHAKYIKRWVPELRDIDPNSIHNWVEMRQKDRKKYDTEYPEPIIKFNQRYHKGKKMFENALGE